MWPIPLPEGSCAQAVGNLDFGLHTACYLVLSSGGEQKFNTGQLNVGSGSDEMFSSGCIGFGC